MPGHTSPSSAILSHYPHTQHNSQQVARMDALFEASFSPLSASGERLCFFPSQLPAAFARGLGGLALKQTYLPLQQACFYLPTFECLQESLCPSAASAGAS